MTKPIQTGRISDPLERALELSGRVGPGLEEIITPMVLAFDVTGLPWSRLGTWTASDAVGPTAAQTQSVSLSWQANPSNVVNVIRRLWIVNANGAAVIFRVVVDARPAAAAVRDVYYSDFRRAATVGGIAAPSALQVSHASAAVAPGGIQLHEILLPAGQTAEVRNLNLIIPSVVSGQALVVYCASVNSYVCAIFEGELYEVTPPADQRI